MSKLNKDDVIDAFTQAYTKANGKAPEIEAKGGWYSVDGGKNIRLAQLVEMTESLAGGSAEASAPKQTTVEKSQEKQKAKPAAKKQAAKSGFSVKAFWEQQIMQANPGAIKPR